MDGLKWPALSQPSSAFHEKPLLPVVLHIAELDPHCFANFVVRQEPSLQPIFDGPNGHLKMFRCLLLGHEWLDYFVPSLVLMNGRCQLRLQFAVDD